MHHLADQLLATDKDRWNVVLGDDAGGRLVSHFVHRVLKDDGRDFQTFFVAGSGVYRKPNGTEPYDRYFNEIAEKVGEPLRPLIVTETVDTGTTIEFLRDRLAPFSEQRPDVAAVAVREDQLENVEYVGGVGDVPIEMMYFAYESPLIPSLGRRAMKKIWGSYVPEVVKESIRCKTAVRLAPPMMNKTVGLEVDPASPVPVVDRSLERDGRFSTEAYRRIESMAHDVKHSVDA